jgi:hypothetical protein
MGSTTMPGPCKAIITFGDVKIVLEGPQEFIEEQVEKYSNSETSKNVNKNLFIDEHSEQAGLVLVGERELVIQKQPRGHHEIVAVLAFCLTEAGQTEFGEEEIRRAYIRAVVRPPKVIAQALRDAKNVHDFLESAGRGRYRLSAHGDRTVRFDLPRRGGEA